MSTRHSLLLAFAAGLAWAAAAEVDTQAHAVDWMAVGRWTVVAFCAVVLARPLCAGLRALARLAVPTLFAFLLLSLGMFATTPNGVIPTREEKERIRAALAAAESERAALGSLLTGGTRSGEVTNGAPAFAFTMVGKETNRVELAATWTPEYVFSAIGLYHSRRLESNDWARIGLRTDVSGGTNCAWTITDPTIVTNKAAFFDARGFLADDDSDADGVPAALEIELGLDPDLSDSDGDLLSDGEELGFAEVLPEDEFLWIDIPHFMNYVVGGFDAIDSAGIDENLGTPISVNGTDYRSIHATLDGHVYLAPQTGMGPPAVDWCDPSQGAVFGLSSLARGCVSVFGCNADMGARKTTWGSGLYFDTVATNGVEYDVVEFRNIGLYSDIASDSPSLTYEVVFPRSEPNVVYVSYLTVDPSLAAMDMPLGVQCDSAREFGDTNRYYTVRGPAPMAGRTVRYRIGTLTSPLVAEYDDYGIPLGYPRVSTFDADGDGLVDALDSEPAVCGGDFHGQSDAWVQATFTNAAEILSVGYPQWVDAQVGVGLANGLYKLTVAVSDDLPEATLVSVGELSVVVTNAGEYVFVLEKGPSYDFAVFPPSGNVTISAVDDIAATRGSPIRPVGNGGNGTWTPDGGGFWTDYAPNMGHARLWWLPWLCGSPDVAHIGPNDEVTFLAILGDYCRADDVAFHWTASEGLSLSTPYAQSTSVTVDLMPSWASASASVTATFGDRSLTSCLGFLSYGTNATPQVHMSLNVPEAILLNSNEVDAAKIVPVSWSFASDVPTSGTVRVTCVSGDGKFRAPGFLGPRMVEGEMSVSRSIEGLAPSESIGDVVFRMQFTSGEGTNTIERAMTVVRVCDVQIPAAPADGLVVLTNTPVALQLECEPQGAGAFLSSMWHTRRLKSDGTHEEWQLAAYNQQGSSLVFTPTLGGIYHVRAVASVAAGGSDERYYVWDADEAVDIGLKRKGGVKAFGVCDKQWQIDLRNCSKSFLGSTAYLEMSTVPAQYGFSESPGREDVYKCNLFVAHRAVQSGLSVPAIHGRLWRAHPPLANEWGNRSFSIEGWDCVDALEFPQPGYISSDPAPDGAPGHVGIVDFDGEGISAGQKNVNRNFSACDQDTVLRKYTGGAE